MNDVKPTSDISSLPSNSDSEEGTEESRESAHEDETVEESQISLDVDEIKELEPEHLLAKEMYCPNLKCQKVIERGCDCMFGSHTSKVTCEYCGRDACFKCRQHWHEGTTCGDPVEAGIRTAFMRKYHRSCP